MKELYSIQVKEVENQPIKQRKIIYRIPINRKGYQIIRYKNEFFQLFGGIRNNFFIAKYAPLPIIIKK